ncbi:unnamed protein product, partial [Rotaria sp. Silwood1]
MQPAHQQRPPQRSLPPLLL